MSVTEMVLLSAALSIDGLSIGASCGLGRIRIPLRSRLIITAVTVIVTGAAVAAGCLLGGFIPELAGKLTGAVLLFAIGAFMIFGELRKKTERTEKNKQGILSASARLIASPQECDPDESRNIDDREALVIGIALSADSFAAGISAGIGGAEAFFVPVMCTAFQLLFMLLGEKGAAGLRNYIPHNGKIIGIIAGAILIVTAALKIVI